MPRKSPTPTEGWKGGGGRGEVHTLKHAQTSPVSFTRRETDCLMTQVHYEQSRVVRTPHLNTYNPQVDTVWLRCLHIVYIN